MKIFHNFLFVTVLYSLLVLTKATSSELPYDIKNRSADTCGDPSLAMTYYTGYSQILNAHTLNILPEFINDQLVSSNYIINAPSFRAWRDANQTGTVPLYFFLNGETSDYFFTIGNTGTGLPPASPGFTFEFIVVYVYPTQICGSVPLYVVSNTVAGDHFYTINSLERDYFITHLTGWQDEGIAAYVLPLDGVNL